MSDDAERCGEPTVASPRYATVRSMRTRASADEVQLDEYAATALDRPKITHEDFVGRHAPTLPPSASATSAAAGSTSTSFVVRIAVAVMASALAGALAGAWLALRGG